MIALFTSSPVCFSFSFSVCLCTDDFLSAASKALVILWLLFFETIMASEKVLWNAVPLVFSKICFVGVLAGKFLSCLLRAIQMTVYSCHLINIIHETVMKL